MTQTFKPFDQEPGFFAVEPSGVGLMVVNVIFVVINLKSACVSCRYTCVSISESRCSASDNFDDSSITEEG